MSRVLSIAASGLAAQSRRVEAVAQVVASPLGTAAPAASTVSQSPSVSIGALPVSDTLEQSMVTLVEAKNAYAMNAAVIKTADEMFDTLLKTADAD